VADKWQGMGDINVSPPPCHFHHKLMKNKGYIMILVENVSRDVPEAVVIQHDGDLIVCPLNGKLPWVLLREDELNDCVKIAYSLEGST
jgi:hypothetical protein